MTEFEGEKLVQAWQVFSTALKEKHLLIYLNEAELQKKVSQFGWAGEVVDRQGDYLAVVHTNVAGGKTDRVIKVQIKHQVEIMDDGTAIVNLNLIKEHRGDSQDVFEGQTNVDYIRFYVPAGSKLLLAQGFDEIPSDRTFQLATSGVEVDPDLERIERNLRVDNESGMRMSDEFGKTVFANWLVVAAGESKEVKIKYLLPFRFENELKAGVGVNMAAGGQDYSWWDLVKQYFRGKRAEKEHRQAENQIYSLLVQKQPGTQGREFESSLKLSAGWEISQYLPKDKLTIGESGVTYRGDLRLDEYYGVVITGN